MYKILGLYRVHCPGCIGVWDPIFQCRRRAELPDHLIRSVSGDRLGKSPWALKENLCHGPSKNIPLWAFLVPYINHSKHSKLFKNLGGKNHARAAYSKIMVGCSCCSNCTNQPFQVSLLRIAAAAMDSTVKVPPQTWNLGKCIVVPLERCWKMHKTGERSLESRLWNLWNRVTMLFYHELSRSQWPPVSWHFFKLPSKCQQGNVLASVSLFGMCPV